MIGKKLKDSHTEDQLKEIYLKCRDPREKLRWQALWLLKRGMKLVAVSEVIGRSKNSIRIWRDWYNELGYSRVKGKPIPGKPSKLTQNQYEKLDDWLRAYLNRKKLTAGKKQG